MSKLKVLCLVKNYPTLSETYKESEFRALSQDYDLKIASFGGSFAPYSSHLPFQRVEKKEEVRQVLADFRPDIIHGHYLHSTKLLHNAAELSGCRYTVRTHSFDILGRDEDFIREHAPFVNADRCAGLLAFPFLRETLVRGGVRDDKIVDAWPVIDFDRFHDPSPNGDLVMNTGACIPKKNMNSFVDLGRMTPELDFHMYPIGYHAPLLVAYNKEAGEPVTIHNTVEPHEMPPIYKRHRWMVYTGDPDLPTIGWPLSIAEAQASGVGVLVQRVREDLHEYVGPGGYVYDTLEEAREIIRGPFPEAAREASFDHARKSDIRANLHRLTDLWRRVNSPVLAEDEAIA